MNPATPSVQQARPPGETKWYSPARDITCIMPSVIRAALQKWPDENNTYREWTASISKEEADAQACKVAEALAAFCSEECVVEPKSYKEALERAGLYGLPRATQIAIYAAITEELLCAFWLSVRMATSRNEQGNIEILQYDPEALTAATREMIKIMRMPAWQRRIWRLWDTLRNRLVKRLRG